MSTLRLHPAIFHVIGLSLLAFACPFSHAIEIDGETRAKLDRWVESQQETRALTAAFVQERQLRTIRRPMITKGRMWWQREAGFRWELGAPPKLVLIQDAEGRVAEIRPARKKAKLRSREEAQEQIHGLGFGFSTFFDADPGAWENKLELRLCMPVESNPDQIVAHFGFREAKLATAVRKMIVVADIKLGDLREFQLIFRDQSTIRLHFDPMEKNSPIEPSLFEIKLDGYTVEHE